MSEKKTLRVVTLGCSKNTVDTEHLLIQAKGYYKILSESDTDFVDYMLLNTCGFIGDAKQESIEAILEAVELKKTGKIGHVVVFGCLSERYIDDMPKLIPEVDGWFGARGLDDLMQFLGITPNSSLKNLRLLPVSTSGKHSYAFIKISEGCDRRCSYCAIPFIRGRHISVPMEDVLEEARFLASIGVRELVVIAQDTTYYGLDIYHRRALAELLQKMSEIEGIEWIRIHYSYPAGFPEDVLDLMAENPKICRYMDIPLQHISDKVLDMMHRHVDGKWTRDLVRKMREKVPGVALRTTMIVGHPGEAEEDFEELLEFAREFRFERLGAFTYSEEEGTYDAEHFPDTIPQEVKQERLDRLMELQSGISLDFNYSRVGNKEKILIDKFTDGVFVCRSEFESPEVDGEVLMPYESEAFGNVDPYSLIGEFVEAEIISANEYDLAAKFISFL